MTRRPGQNSSERIGICLFAQSVLVVGLHAWSGWGPAELLSARPYTAIELRPPSMAMPLTGALRFSFVSHRFYIIVGFGGRALLAPVAELPSFGGKSVDE